MLESWGERRERGRGASFALRPRQHGRGGKGTSVFFIHLISLSFFLLSFSCFLLFLIILVFFLFFRYFPFPSSFLSSLYFHANRAKEDNFLITQSRFEERHLIFLSYQTADFYPRFINRINILEFKGITLLYTHNFSRAGKCIQSCIFVRSAYFLFRKKKKKIRSPITRELVEEFFVFWIGIERKNISMFIDFYRKIKKEKIRNKNPKRTSIIAQFKKNL